MLLETLAPGFIFDTVFRFYSFHQERDDASTFSKLQLKLWKVFAGMQVNDSGPREEGRSHVGGQYSWFPISSWPIL